MKNLQWVGSGFYRALLKCFGLCDVLWFFDIFDPNAQTHTFYSSFFSICFSFLGITIKLPAMWYFKTAWELKVFAVVWCVPALQYYSFSQSFQTRRTSVGGCVITRFKTGSFGMFPVKCKYFSYRFMFFLCQFFGFFFIRLILGNTGFREVWLFPFHFVCWTPLP